MNWFLLLLLKLLPGVDDDGQDDGTDNGDDGQDDGQGDGADDNDDGTDDGADDGQGDGADDNDDSGDSQNTPPPRESRAAKAIREQRERAQKAETDLATARAELEAARRGPAQPAQPNPEQQLWAQEEETLRNPEASDWQKYAIRSAREARQARSESQAALRHAEDLSDRTQFAALAATQPKLYSAYKDRVEAKLQELRREGRNVNREGILKVLIGEDMLAGKLKVGESKARTNGAAPRAPRQDVTPARNGGMSDAEKRAKRLENVRI